MRQPKSDETLQGLKSNVLLSRLSMHRYKLQNPITTCNIPYLMGPNARPLKLASRLLTTE